MESETDLDTTVKTSLAVGTLLDGKYRIISLIGGGGMASVYRARHEVLAQDVAIKLLHAETGEAGKQMQRLKREAMTVQRISHPNIVRVHSLGLSNNTPFIVMDYIKGRSLAEELKLVSRIELPRAIGLFKQVCSGLEAAHQAGVVHRDLKPGNIMLLENDRAMIVDFGISKFFDNESSVPQKVTVTDMSRGSPHYMSPERCMGAPENARSDIYSLGCLMYECLTGEPPFSADSALAVFAKHVNDEVVVPSAFDKSASIWVIIKKCLMKAPEARYKTAAEIESDLCDLELNGELSNLLIAKNFDKPNSDRQLRVRRWAAIMLIGLATVSIALSFWYRNFAEQMHRQFHAAMHDRAISAEDLEKKCQRLWLTEDEKLMVRAKCCVLRGARERCRVNLQDALRQYSGAEKFLLQCRATTEVELMKVDVLIGEAIVSALLNENLVAKSLFERAITLQQIPALTFTSEPTDRDFKLALTYACAGGNYYMLAKDEIDKSEREDLKEKSRDCVYEAERLFQQVPRQVALQREDFDESRALVIIFLGDTRHLGDRNTCMPVLFGPTKQFKAGRHR